MGSVDRELRDEVEQFLYREARLLDTGRFHEWLELFTDDVRYWVPIRETVMGSPEGIPADDEMAAPHIDEDKATLALRVKRFDTGMAWAEVPVSRTRHFITNVEVEADPAGAVTAYSNFLLYQGRRETSEYQFSGRREDRLCRVDGEWKIRRRKVVLDHTVLPRSISVFF